MCIHEKDAERQEYGMMPPPPPPYHHHHGDCCRGHRSASLTVADVMLTGLFLCSLARLALDLWLLFAGREEEEE